MKIYIDITTGTWGMVHDLRVVVLDEDELVHFVDRSDDEISSYGHVNGQKVN